MLASPSLQQQTLNLLQDRYKILRLITTRSFSRVFLAEDLLNSSPSQVLIKELGSQHSDPRYLEISRRLFNNEINSLKRLGGYPQTPRLMDWFKDGDSYFVVQEFIAGDLLSQELPSYEKSQQIFRADQGLDLLQEVLPALHFIHQQGIVHCDLKPDNIIRRHKDNKLVIIDFGSAQAISAPQRSHPLATGKQLKYKHLLDPCGYAAPEQLSGHAQPCSDLYALGIICLQALTGKEPWQLQQDLSANYLPWEPRYLGDHFLRSVLQRMVAFDMQSRYQSAQEVIQFIHRYLDSKSPKSSYSLTDGCLDSCPDSCLDKGSYADSYNSGAEIIPVLPLENLLPKQQHLEEEQKRQLECDRQVIHADYHRLSRPHLSIMGTGMAIGLGVNSVLIAMGLNSLANAQGRDNKFDVLTQVPLPDFQQPSPKHEL